MAKERKKSHSRAPGMTQISISLPEHLVKKVDDLADKVNRSRSNYIAYILQKISDGNGEAAESYLKIAESKEKFGSSNS